MRWYVILVALVALSRSIHESTAPNFAVNASTAVPVEVEDLVANAALLLEAKITSARCIAGVGGCVDTEYSLAVARTFWGEHAPVQVLRLPGGVLPDGRGMVLPGVPHFSLGEDVVLALSEANDDGLRMPIGLDQGCYRLRVEANGDRFAWRVPAASARIDMATGRIHSGGAAWGAPYGQLVARMTAAVAARRSGVIGPSEVGR
ncbi:MAG: hypothetical protein ACI841_002174 [Planctomycetota bacterium]|jgi:hypothetical protein